MNELVRKELIEAKSNLEVALYTTGVNALSVENVDKPIDLSVVVAVAGSISDKLQYPRAKALFKLRELFAKEKERVSALNKARKKGEAKHSVNIMGYSTFVELCESEFGLSQASANSYANVAQYLDASGLRTIFAPYCKGDKDYTYTQLLVLSGAYSKHKDRLVADMLDGKIRPDMTITSIKAVIALYDAVEINEDKPVEDKPVEGKPVEDKPAEDKPVEGKPVEDKPVEDKPVEGKPVEDKPVSVTLTRRQWALLVDDLNGRGQYSDIVALIEKALN